MVFDGLLLFFAVYFLVRLAHCGRACLPQPKMANLNLRSLDLVRTAESQTFPLPLFHLMFAFGSFASRPHPVLSPAHFCFGLAVCLLGGFVHTQCWELTLVLFFACSCFRLWFCILVSFEVFCFLALRVCSWSFADYCLFSSSCFLFWVLILKF